MWGKIIVPMYRLWLHGLYGLYGPRCPLSPKRPINLISLSFSLSLGPIVSPQAHPPVGYSDLNYTPVRCQFRYFRYQQPCDMYNIYIYTYQSNMDWHEYVCMVSIPGHWHRHNWTCRLASHYWDYIPGDLSLNNPLMPKQNSRHFADDIFKRIYWMKMLNFGLEFHYCFQWSNWQ